MLFPKSTALDNIQSEIIFLRSNAVNLVEGLRINIRNGLAITFNKYAAHVGHRVVYLIAHHIEDRRAIFKRERDACLGTVRKRSRI